MCKVREHYLCEEITTGGVTTCLEAGFETDRNYLTLSESTDHDWQISYGTALTKFTGSHYLQLHVNLQNYTHITDNSARINITFFNLIADLTMPDFEYTLNEGEVLIPVPALEFDPPLYESVNEDTGESGDEILHEVLLK